jgi:hypothetical protein
MASVTDILTSVQNVVRAISNLGTTYLRVQGYQVETGISTTTLVMNRQGRLVRIAVVTAGSTAGVAYDAKATGITSSPLVAIPNTVGIIDVNLPVDNGIVIAPGTGQVVTVSFS